MNPNGTLSLDSWQVFQAYFVQRGLQNRVLDLQPYVDTTALDVALSSLGREAVDGDLQMNSK